MYGINPSVMGSLACKTDTSNERPLSLYNQIVPPSDRKQWDHKIYWAHNSRLSRQKAERYNTIAETLKPCLKRWLEFHGEYCPPDISFSSSYSPPSILPKPARYWVLCDKDTGEQVASFTNVCEGFWIVLGAERYTNTKRYILVYMDADASVDAGAQGETAKVQ